MYKFCFLFIFWAIPQQLFAMPLAIARIVRIFEGQNKQKGAQPKGDQAMVVDGAADDSQSLPLLSPAQQARLAIDEAIKDRKLVGHPATWYYRGVIYDRLLRDHIAEASTLLDEALASYEQAKQLGLVKSKQFYSFALSNLSALWHYFLNRGVGYYRQEAVDQAIAQFAICRRILPEEPTPLLYTAIAYHSVDQPEKALRYYQDYLAVQGPQFAVARAMAAIHYHKLKNFDKAIAILNEALLQFPFNSELLEEKCLIYEAAGQIDAYVTALAVEIQHKKIDASYAYAYLLAYQGRTQEAIAYYQQVLKEAPNQYDTLRQMGFIFYNEAIKLYAHTLKLVENKQPLAHPTSADWCGLMQVTVRHWFPYTMEWAGRNRGWFPRLGADALIWVVYAHPLVQHSSVSSLVHLVQAGNLPFTSALYGYVHAKNAAAWADSKSSQSIIALECYLKQALCYLKMARAQDKKDQEVAQALYYSYYHLKKYGAAHRLLQAMQKPYLEDDPFIGHTEKKASIY